MNLSEFKAGKPVQRYQYKSFEPNKVDIDWQIDNADLIMQLSEANLKLGELNAFSQLIPDVDFLLKCMFSKRVQKAVKLKEHKPILMKLFKKKNTYFQRKKMTGEKFKIMYKQ